MESGVGANRVAGTVAWTNKADFASGFPYNISMKPTWLSVRFTTCLGPAAGPIGGGGKPGPPRGLSRIRYAAIGHNK